jgi:hypothetical protein
VSKFSLYAILTLRGVFKTRTGQLEKALKAGKCSTQVVVNAEKVSKVILSSILSSHCFFIS